MGHHEGAPFFLTPWAERLFVLGRYAYQMLGLALSMPGNSRRSAQYLHPLQGGFGRLFHVHSLRFFGECFVCANGR